MAVDPLTSTEADSADVVEEVEETAESTVGDSDLGSDPSELETDVDGSWISLHGHDGHDDHLKTPSA